MKNEFKKILSRVLIAAGVAWAGGVAAYAGEPALFISTGNATRAPIGWVEFCSEQPAACAPQAHQQSRQQPHQADDRHGSLGAGGEMVLS